ncbi:hypothetical protein NQ317_007795 [Molorchus minor]|uniref:Uncharacterized protein n=1 Tax=Molorchus minor TaxID=1323400 RepID=A0ABQ9IZB2_9CUCU|nr:hypothetical protein NQ317_007795 [Molorchus minor]
MYSRDLTELQTALARFVAASRIYLKYPLDPRWMLQLLTDIENAWMNFTLTREEEMWLAEKFTAMQERWLQQLRHHRQLFPALHPASLARLEYILRCLAYMSNMKAFWKCCPFNKEIRGEIVATLRRGTPEWFAALKATVMSNDEFDASFVDFCSEVYVQLKHGLSHYHPLFEGTNGIPYFSVVFKQVDKLLADEVIAFLNQNEHPDAAYNRLIFAVYLEVKDLATFNQNLPMGGDHKLLLPPMPRVVRAFMLELFPDIFPKERAFFENFPESQTRENFLEKCVTEEKISGTLIKDEGDSRRLARSSNIFEAGQLERFYDECLLLFYVDGGGDITCLKRYGGWKSRTAAEDYSGDDSNSTL